MQKRAWILSLVAFASVCCSKAPTRVSSSPTPSSATSASPSGAFAMLTTQFPTDDHLVLAWSITGFQHVRLEMGGQNVTINTSSHQVKVKVELKKDPKADQVDVTLDTSEGTMGSGGVGHTQFNVGGIPNGADGKPVSMGSILTPTVSKAQPLRAGDEVTLAKGAGAFPSLIAHVSD